MIPTNHDPTHEHRARRRATVKEVSAHLHLGLHTTYRLIKAGVIPSAKIGAAIRVDLQRVDELLENGDLTGVRE